MRSSITAQFTVTFALVSAVVVAGFAVMTFTAGHLQSTDHQRAGSRLEVGTGDSMRAERDYANSNASTYPLTLNNLTVTGNASLLLGSQVNMNLLAATVGAGGAISADGGAGFTSTGAGAAGRGKSRRRSFRSPSTTPVASGGWTRGSRSARRCAG